jgi:hypothetical protein
MELRLGPLPVLQTFGQRAVLLAGGILEGTGDCPCTGASELGDGGFRFRHPVLDDLPVLSSFQSR